MMHLKTIAAGTAIAGSLGLAALGLGAGVANAAPTSPNTAWAQDAGWDHGRGPGPWGPGWGGPGWAPPPPPPYYGYGVGYAPPCVTGPLGLLHLCA